MAASLRGIKIARVSTVPYFVVTQLKGQIDYLSQAGAQVVVITSSGAEIQGIASETVSVEMIEIPRSIRLFKDVIALFRLFRCFRRHRFAIVHSTTPKAGLLCAVAGALAFVPIRLHTFTGQPWVGLTGVMRRLVVAADWLIGRLNTRCYADSESQRDFLVAERVIPGAKIGVIGQGSLAGVDLRRFDTERWPEAEKTVLRRELKLSETGKVILFVGRITRDKGVRELLDAFNALVKQAYDADLVLVGPLDDEHGGTAEFGPVIAGAQRVHHAGYINQPERYMALADLMCLPSYREGFGTVVIEAAAMGVPTLGTRIYGLSDAVKDGETGILVPPRDSAALFDAMRMLLDNPEQLAKMGLAARTRCLEHFDAARINERLAEEYVRLLKA
jgi:glycosyltransferase involved in cell wall biosynthesis